MFEFLDVAGFFSSFSDFCGCVSFGFVFCEDFLLEFDVDAADVAGAMFFVCFVEVAYDL